MASVRKYRKRQEDGGRPKRDRDAVAALLDADRHFQNWDLEPAVASAQLAVKLFRSLGDQAGAADALCVLLRSLGSQEKVGEAEALVRSELAQFRSMGDAGGQAKMLLVQAEMCYHQGEGETLEESTVLAREALELFEGEGDTLGQAQAWMTCAEANVSAGKYKVAVHPARKAARLFKLAEDEPEELRACLLVTQASIGMLTKGSRDSTWTAWEEVLLSLDESLKRVRGLGDATLEGTALTQLAEAHNTIGSYEEALKFSKEASKLYYELGATQDMASALHWTADTHIKCERYREARETAQEIRQLGQEHQDPSLEELAETLLDSIANPGAGEAPPQATPKTEESSKPEGEEVETAEETFGTLVRNQQGDVMDVRNGLVFKAMSVPPDRIADITAQVLANYTREEFDNEIPIMQAGIAGPLRVDLQSEWFRKYHVGLGEKTSIPAEPL